jgi:ElaB/YqjD/DUF883 family membrane-anchored ribosome-binding protein
MAKGDSKHPRMTSDYPAGTTSQSEESKGLKEKAQEMASNLGETAGQLKEKAREYASGWASQAEESWRGAREGMQENFSGMTQRAEDFLDDVTGLIRRYPVASVAIAFGLGCLASFALTMTSSSDDMTQRMSQYSS